jgi:tRNA uridine 5-carbamoylmethylation protein Kti12
MLVRLQASRHRLLQETQLRLQQHQQQQHGKQRMLLLVDDINHYRSMRYEFVQLARARELAGCADTAVLFGGSA